MGIKVDQLAATVQKELGVYSEAVTAEIKKVVDTVSKEAVTALKNSSPRRGGKYGRGWQTAAAYESARTKRSTVHNRTSYQLTHLLENGHAKRGGGRVSPATHIAPVEKAAMQKLKQGIKEAAERAT
jgi:hypothetical protein